MNYIEGEINSMLLLLAAGVAEFLLNLFFNPETL